MSATAGSGPRRPARRRIGPVAGLLSDVLRVRSASIGCLLPVLAALVCLAALLALFAQVIPWAIYPAL